jgi:hypothetical protein
MAKTSGTSKGKPQQSKASGRSGNGHEDDAPKAGDGWEDVTADRAPWLIMKPKMQVSGFLLGRYSFGSGRDTRYYYQLKLTMDGVEAASGKGDERSEVSLNRGDVISIGETFALGRDLAPLSDDGGKYEIRLYIGTPEYDRQGKPQFWPIKVQKRTISPPTRTPKVEVRAREERRDLGPEDDMPF